MTLREKLLAGMVIPAHPLALNSDRKLDPDKQQAQAKLTALKGKALASLEGKAAYTIAVQKDGGTVYRARFAGFDSETAKKACAKISDKLIFKCLINPPG